MWSSEMRSSEMWKMRSSEMWSFLRARMELAMDSLQS